MKVPTKRKLKNPDMPDLIVQDSDIPDSIVADTFFWEVPQRKNFSLSQASSFSPSFLLLFFWSPTISNLIFFCSSSSQFLKKNLAKDFFFFCKIKAFHLCLSSLTENLRITKWLNSSEIFLSCLSYWMKHQSLLQRYKNIMKFPFLL